MVKSSGRMLLRQNAPKSEHWRFFSLEIASLWLLLKIPFWQALPSLSNNKAYAGGPFYCGKKPNSRDRNNTQYGGKQKNKWSSGVYGKQSSRSKPDSLVHKISRVHSSRISNKCPPFSAKYVYRKNNVIGSWSF